MNARLVNPFLHAAYNLLRATVGVPSRAPDTRFEHGMLISCDVSIVLGIEGGLFGTVTYDMDERLAKLIAGTLAGTAMPIIVPAVEGVLHRIGGALAQVTDDQLRRDGFECNVHMKSMVLGRGILLIHSEVPHLVVPFVTSGGTLTARVAVDPWAADRLS